MPFFSLNDLIHLNSNLPLIYLFDVFPACSLEHLYIFHLFLCFPNMQPATKSQEGLVTLRIVLQRLKVTLHAFIKHLLSIPIVLFLFRQVHHSKLRSNRIFCLSNSRVFQYPYQLFLHIKKKKVVEISRIEEIIALGFLFSVEMFRQHFKSNMPRLDLTRESEL